MTVFLYTLIVYDRKHEHRKRGILKGVGGREVYKSSFLIVGYPDVWIGGVYRIWLGCTLHKKNIWGAASVLGQ